MSSVSLILAFSASVFAQEKSAHAEVSVLDTPSVRNLLRDYGCRPECRVSDRQLRKIDILIKNPSGVLGRFRIGFARSRRIFSAYARFEALIIHHTNG